MKGTVHYEVRDDVALMTIDNPPVNPLSLGTAGLERWHRPGPGR